MMHSGNPLQTQQSHSQSASQDQNRNSDLLRGFDVEDLHKGVNETLGVSDQFLLNLTQDTAIAGHMLKPHHKAKKQDQSLQPESGIDGVRDDNHDEQGVRHKMMNPSQELTLAFIVGFPKENLVDRPLRPLCRKLLHSLTEDERWHPRTHPRSEGDGQLPRRTGCSVS